MLGISPFLPLRADQLNRLCDHKYNCSGSSFTEPLLQNFWNSIVVYVPSKIAPNTLTLVGLITNTLATLCLIFYSQKAISDIPPAALIFAAISSFVYQTLDAVDGKHARRTNSSSPLGELFDHGCDSISMLFVPLSVFISFGMGQYPVLMFIEFFCLMTLFYNAHWQAYVTGSLQFRIIDVTEGEVICIIVFILTSIFGISLWAIPIPFLGVNFRILQFVIVIVFCTIRFADFSNTVLEGGTGKSGTTVANTSVLFPLCPFGLVILLAIFIAFRSPSGIYYNNPVLFLGTFGIVLSKVTQKLIVAHMSKSEIFISDSVLVGPGMLLLNQYFDYPINERYMLYAFLLWSAFDVLRYSINVCLQVAGHLNIYIFRVGKPESSTSSGKIADFHSGKHDISGQRTSKNYKPMANKGKSH